MIAVDRRARRVWICDRRCHHGAVGLALAAAGLLAPSPALVTAGVLLLWHDRADWPFPLEKRSTEPEGNRP